MTVELESPSTLIRELHPGQSPPRVTSGLTAAERRLGLELDSLLELERLLEQGGAGLPGDPTATGLTAFVCDQLVEVQAAFGRLRDGRYGICESCGRPITDSRLAAFPLARRCLADDLVAEAAELSAVPGRSIPDPNPPTPNPDPFPPPSPSPTPGPIPATGRLGR